TNFEVGVAELLVATGIVEVREVASAIVVRVEVHETAAIDSDVRESTQRGSTITTTEFVVDVAGGTRAVQKGRGDGQTRRLDHAVLESGDASVELVHANTES